MELDLSRLDYTIVGLTSRNCMKLLPSNYLKEPQKVAVADKDGILQVFSIKKEDISLVFKTLPGSEITSLRLGGAMGTSTDKIFVALDSEVHGYTRKGKLFLTFDSCMTEPIVSMFVLENDLFLCGNHIYNHYRDCKEIGAYLCGDKIVDVIAFHQEQTGRLISLIACEGRMIRVLEHGRVTLSMEVDSAPTVLHVLEQDEEKYVLFGTQDGRVGLLDVKNSQGFERWLIVNGETSSNISCIDSYDLTGDGNNNLVIGKQDGNIEIYNINISDPNDASLLIFSYNCNESVTAVQCGILNTGGFDEVLVSTYTGRIFSLTSEKIEKNVEKNEQGENMIFSADTANKISKLRNEIDDLQRKVAKEREKYQSSTQSIFDEYSAIPLLAVNDSFILDKQYSTYTLTIEVPTAIDNILLQSDVKLDLLDVEKNSAVVSYSECLAESRNALLVTYRCQMNTNRLEIKIRTIEGQSGVLQAYITPLVQPKCSRVRKYEVKPLSHHYRVHNVEHSGNVNTLSIKGSFSLAEIHAWICKCVPEVPEKPQATQANENNSIFFKSSFLGTILQCCYSRGDASFKSNNISTISIIKEFISNEATKKNIKVEFSIGIDEQTVDDVLKILIPNLQKHQKFKKDIALLDALHELELSEEENMNSLSERYRKLLAEESILRNDFNNNPDYLGRLYGIVCDLYADYNKMKGINIKSKLPQLMKVLEDVDFHKLLEFFKPEKGIS
ncbi:Bardet-Biedl syndrome 7 protein homolog [Coccinella septempunctata]|uniref:Bardet-Biedl syndrome 7 protein homolog n=1 Tax=Coccinella septempunctata TaxID=41139 RepID=UPI001D08AA6E|nr:Bardet-Biedl syndrome 7 protein homolog [Coccinella septempunctata]